MIFKNIEKLKKQLNLRPKLWFDNSANQTTQEFSQVIARENLFQLNVWIRWEFLLFFLLATLIIGLLNSFAIIDFSNWQPYVLIFTAFLLINSVLQTNRKHLCHFSLIYYFQFCLDTLLISWIVYINGPHGVLWALYLILIFLSIFLLRQKTETWSLLCWIGICFGFVCHLHYLQAQSEHNLMLLERSLKLLTDYLNHWLLVMSILAVLALICTQLVAYVHENIRKLKGEVIIDEVTGLYNRSYFLRMLNSEIERCRRYDHIFSLMMIDLDNFNKFNEIKGLEEGDSLLRTVAEIFRTHIRRDTGEQPYDIDIPCRYSGEEFVIIMPEVSIKTSWEAAERIRKVIHREIAVQIVPESNICTTVSIGVASFPDHADTINDLIHVVDSALNEAKHRGKNQVITADELFENVPGNFNFDK